MVDESEVDVYRTPGIEELSPEPYAHGQAMRNTTRRAGRKIATGQPRVGHLSEPSENPTNRSGAGRRANDGVTDPSPMR